MTCRMKKTVARYGGRDGANCSAGLLLQRDLEEQVRSKREREAQAKAKEEEEAAKVRCSRKLKLACRALGRLTSACLRGSAGPAERPCGSLGSL